MAPWPVASRPTVLGSRRDRPWMTSRNFRSIFDLPRDAYVTERQFKLRSDVTNRHTPSDHCLLYTLSIKYKEGNAQTPSPLERDVIYRRPLTRLTYATREWMRGIILLWLYDVFALFSFQVNHDVRGHVRRRRPGSAGPSTIPRLHGARNIPAPAPQTWSWLLRSGQPGSHMLPKLSTSDPVHDSRVQE
jgi:hypothetical protein